jgi:hypothetical protein
MLRNVTHRVFSRSSLNATTLLLPFRVAKHMTRSGIRGGDAVEERPEDAVERYCAKATAAKEIAARDGRP